MYCACYDDDMYNTINTKREMEQLVTECSGMPRMHFKYSWRRSKDRNILNKLFDAYYVHAQ